MEDNLKSQISNLKNISQKSNLFQTIKQLWRFTIVGTGATGVDFGTYLLLTKIFGIHYLLANFVSMTLGAIVGYWFNKTYTFGDTDKRVVRQYAVYWINALVVFLIGEGLLFVTVHYLGIWDVAAKFVVYAILYFINFFFQKIFIFKRTIKQ
ncbi:MAG: GtrA family protein [Patescibacteria group bacterium]|nr:GtrA family protein [Patescibacteria group bacterium]